VNPFEFHPSYMQKSTPPKSRVDFKPMSTTSPSRPSLAYDAYAHHGRNLIENFHANLQVSKRFPVPGSPELRIPSTVRRLDTSNSVGTIGILGAGQYSSISTVPSLH